MYVKKERPFRHVGCCYLLTFDYRGHNYFTTPIKLTQGYRTTVANTRLHKKARLIRKSCQKVSFGFPIKSHPIQKNPSIYTGIPINRGDNIHHHPDVLIHFEIAESIVSHTVELFYLTNQAKLYFSFKEFDYNCHFPTDRKYFCLICS